MRKTCWLAAILLLLSMLLGGCATSKKVNLDNWGMPQRSEWEGGPWQDYSP